MPVRSSNFLLRGGRINRPNLVALFFGQFVSNLGRQLLQRQMDRDQEAKDEAAKVEAEQQALQEQTATAGRDIVGKAALADEGQLNALEAQAQTIPGLVTPEISGTQSVPGVGALPVLTPRRERRQVDQAIGAGRERLADEERDRIIAEANDRFGQLLGEVQGGQELSSASMAAGGTDDLTDDQKKALEKAEKGRLQEVRDEEQRTGRAQRVEDERLERERTRFDRSTTEFEQGQADRPGELRDAEMLRTMRQQGIQINELQLAEARAKAAAPDATGQDKLRALILSEKMVDKVSRETLMKAVRGEEILATDMPDERTMQLMTSAQRFLGDIMGRIDMMGQEAGPDQFREAFEMAEGLMSTVERLAGEGAPEPVPTEGLSDAELRAIIDDPNTTPEDLAMLTPDERRRLNAIRGGG